MLEQLRLNWNLPIFGHSVTGAAKSYEVREVVGFLVSLYAELPKRGDVVNVKFATKLLFGQSTMLALIAVALAGLASLLLPVLAIVAGGPTLPLVMIFAYEGSGHPLRLMFLATKVIWRSLCNAAIHFKWGTALRTGYGDLIDLPLIFAIVVAKIVFSYRELIWRTGEDFTTMIARHFDSLAVVRVIFSVSESGLMGIAALLPTIVEFVISDSVMVSLNGRSTVGAGYHGAQVSRLFAQKFSAALYFAKVPLALLDLRWRSLYLFSAVVTGDIDAGHTRGHKKTSCQCVTGCLSRAYGHQQKALQSIAERLLPVNKCMPSTCVIIA